MKVSDGKTKKMSLGVKIYVKEPLEVKTVFSPAKTNLVKAMSQWNKKKPAILVSFRPQISVSDNFADRVVAGEGSRSGEGRLSEP